MDPDRSSRPTTRSPWQSRSARRGPVATSPIRATLHRSRWRLSGVTVMVTCRCRPGRSVWSVERSADFGERRPVVVQAALVIGAAGDGVRRSAARAAPVTRRGSLDPGGVLGPGTGPPSAARRPRRDCREPRGGTLDDQRRDQARRSVMLWVRATFYSFFNPVGRRPGCGGLGGSPSDGGRVDVSVGQAERCGQSRNAWQSPHSTGGADVVRSGRGEPVAGWCGVRDLRATAGVVGRQGDQRHRLHRFTMCAGPRCGRGVPVGSRSPDRHCVPTPARTAHTDR